MSGIDTKLNLVYYLENWVDIPESELEIKIRMFSEEPELEIWTDFKQEFPDIILYRSFTLNTCGVMLLELLNWLVCYDNDWDQQSRPEYELGGGKIPVYLIQHMKNFFETNVIKVVDVLTKISEHPEWMDT
jgi:hypothetical protein